VQSQKLTPGFWRYYGLLLGSMALAISVLSYAFYQEEVKIVRQDIMTRDLHHLEIQQAILNDFLKSAFDALAFITDQTNLYQPFSNPEGRRKLDSDFISFLRTTPLFDQVRLLDNHGREFIRANQTKARPHLVPATKLQDKSSRDYFREAIRMTHGQVYLSGLDLNMEHGGVEQPLKPVIRMAAPVFDGAHKVGILVLNLKMANALERIQQVNHIGESESYLLNPDGFFLSSPHAGWNWGFMLPRRRARNFAAMFPQAWQRISGRDHGQFDVSGSIFSFAAINPLDVLEGISPLLDGNAIGNHRYILVLRFSSETLAQAMSRKLGQYLFLSALLLLAATLLAGALAWNHAQKIHARKLLDASRKTLAHVMSSTPAVHYACRAEGNRFIPTFVSPNLKNLLGWDPDAVIGDAGWWDLHLHPEDRVRVAEGFRAMLSEGKKKYVHEYRFCCADGGCRWVHDELTITYDTEGKAREIVGSWMDITGHKHDEAKIGLALREKEALLREIHHRVKNNMQIISSLLKLQASHVENSDLREMYRDSQNRIKAMSMVHEQLYNSGNITTISALNFLENIVFNLVRSYSTSERRIAVHIDAGKIFLSMDEAVPCGLIVNELVSNALKYAFANENGEINTSLTIPDNEHLLLRVYDNGCGLPPDMNIREPKTLGLQLVNTLADQLGGELTINCEHGTDARILFPAGKEKNA